MLIAAHSIAGGTAGAAIGNPALAFLLGVVLHFILDAIPHYDTTDGGKFTLKQILFVLIDGLVGAVLIITLIIRSDNLPTGFIAGAVGGVFPDILFNLPKIKEVVVKNSIMNSLERFHSAIQKYDLPPIPGVLVQALVIILSIYFFLRFVI